jgi:ATP-dependent DNA helicase
VPYRLLLRLTMARMLVTDLVSLGAPPELVDVWAKHVSQFTDVQERAVRAGALDGRTNLLVMAPTSSGKTFVGELAATSSAYSRRQHAIFLVPFRALADEHYDLFRQRYGDLLTVVISTADWTEFDADIRSGSFNLAVMTYEKLKIFLAQQPDLLTRCTALIVDEVQLLSDPHRGANLELLLTQVLMAPDPPQLIALSASLDEINRLDLWLKATLVSSAVRPIPLTQSVCEPSGAAVVLGPDGTYTQCLTGPQPDREALIVALTHRFLAEDKQVVIFRGSVKKVTEIAHSLRSRRPAAGLSQQLNEELNALEDPEAINELRLCLASGVGFHTADLTYPERSLVERAFRSGAIRALVATTTLAMGVNLPTDVVIIGDSKRFIPARGGTWSIENVAVSEYRNAAGRAGRLGQRTAGYSVLVAENAVEQRQLVSGYLLGHVEPVQSQIPKRPLTDVIFDVICAGLADSEDGIVNFIACTFAYLTFYEEADGGFPAIRNATTAAVRQCISSGLVIQDGQRLCPTQLAQVFGRAGLSLASATRLASVLEDAMTIQSCRQDVIYQIASCAEVGDRPWLQRRGRTELDPRPRHVPNIAGCSPISELARTLAKPMITSDESKALVRAKCLLEWMGGKRLRSITAGFAGMGAAASRVRELGKNAAWLFDALAEAARVCGVPSTVSQAIDELALEARYGLPAALAPIARLRVPGISRDQLLGLYRNTRGVQLHEPDTIIDTPDEEFRGSSHPYKSPGSGRPSLLISTSRSGASTPVTWRVLSKPTWCANSSMISTPQKVAGSNRPLLTHSSTSANRPSASFASPTAKKTFVSRTPTA